ADRLLLLLGREQVQGDDADALLQGAGGGCARRALGRLWLAGVIAGGLGARRGGGGPAAARPGWPRGGPRRWGRAGGGARTGRCRWAGWPRPRWWRLRGRGRGRRRRPCRRLA